MRSLLYPSVRYSLLSDRFNQELKESTPFVEKEGGYYAHFHFPGLKKDAVTVSVHKDSVKVAAQSPEGAIVSIHYDKNFVLPEEANMEELSAQLEDGILTVTIPKEKPLEVAERRIEIS